jgi:hypothetical protein
MPIRVLGFVKHQESGYADLKYFVLIRVDGSCEGIKYRAIDVSSQGSQKPGVCVGCVVCGGVLENGRAPHETRRREEDFQKGPWAVGSPGNPRGLACRDIYNFENFYHTVKPVKL